MAGWKKLSKGEREWVKNVLRARITRIQSNSWPAEPDPERKIGMLAIAIDILDKASPPGG